jgi:DNA-binding transcriptional ArsR family regulator
MSLTNPMGDIEITEPTTMRALAHPVRLAILTHLQRHGPATATQLSSEVMASPSVTSWHLRHLAKFGLVKDWDGGKDGRERWWESTSRGFRVEFPQGVEGQAAYRMLSAQMFNDNLAQIQHWFAEIEPHLATHWREQSGTSNTRIEVSVEELAEIEHAIEKLLSPYLNRPGKNSKSETRGVRMLRFYMPEAVDSDSSR